jgi:hypothetical protein
MKNVERHKKYVQDLVALSDHEGKLVTFAAGVQFKRAFELAKGSPVQLLHILASAKERVIPQAKLMARTTFTRARELGAEFGQSKGKPGGV